MRRHINTDPDPANSKRRKPLPINPPNEVPAAILPPRSVTAVPQEPPAPVAMRYLGNIADLASALQSSRVRFIGNAARAIAWIAGRLGHRLPDTAEGIAQVTLDPQAGWRLVDDRPGLSATEYAESAQRLADLGLLVVAIRTGRNTASREVAMVAPGGMVTASLKPPSKKIPGRRTARGSRPLSPRIEKFTGLPAGSGAAYVAADWTYRQAPAWRLTSPGV